MDLSPRGSVAGVLFDKDGTLFDFNATWGAWSRMLLAQEAAGDAVLLARLADALGYDLGSETFRPGSIVIAETLDTVAAAMVQVMGGDVQALIRRMRAAAETVVQVEAAPLQTLMADLQGMGLRLGVATNDAESSARTHLDRAGVLAQFDFVAGYDSGFGSKPNSGQMRGFCAATGLDPAACVMVGDSLHDLKAGRAAGMITVGVLTGPALRGELTDHADAVLGSIADLPDWLMARQ